MLLKTIISYLNSLEFCVTNIFITFLIILLTYIIINLFRSYEIEKDSYEYQWVKNNIRRTEDCPQTYPNGWNAVLESSNLSKNQIKPIQAFGRDLIVFRGSSGKCYTMDAYCAHMGANLGVGGTVVNDSVRCLFHGWVYDSNGKCTHIPGIDCIKSTNAEIKTYETFEIHDYICVWNPIEDNAPGWYPTQFDQIIDRNVIYRGKSTNIFYGHVGDIFENSADFQHIKEIHAPPAFVGDLIKKPKYYNLAYKLLHYETTSEWRAGIEAKKHTFDVNAEITMVIFGFPTIRTKFFGHFMGPTLSYFIFEINLWRKFQFFITEAIIQSQEFKNYIINKFYSGNGLINIILSRFIINTLCDGFHRDSVVLSNRKYLKQPIIAKNEKSLLDFRRWYKQFDN